MWLFYLRPDGVEDILVSDFESRFTFNVDLPPPEDWIEEQRRSFPSDKHRKRAGELYIRVHVTFITCIYLSDLPSTTYMYIVHYV